MCQNHKDSLIKTENVFIYMGRGDAKAERQSSAARKKRRDDLSEKGLSGAKGPEFIFDVAAKIVGSKKRSKD